jgi:AcrR family transcriptional regulator
MRTDFLLGVNQVPSRSPKTGSRSVALAEPLPIPREEKMLDELESIFLREGFRAVTVEQLARQLRCSKRTIYMLAPSKEALFLRVFDRYLSRLREEGLRGAMAADPVNAFEPYLAPAIDAARKLSTTLMRDMTSFPPANEMWERHTSGRMAGLRRLVQRCVDEGLFREANAFLVAEVVAASLRRIREPKFLAASRLTYREAVEELYGLLLHGLMHRSVDAPVRKK